jgi:hypothetical protein
MDISYSLPYVASNEPSFVTGSELVIDSTYAARHS